MLNTKKLLYILPDAAYIAEVLPTKKAHTFSIHAFRQINGQFIDENEFIAENVQKLIHKIEPEEYCLILPDFLFTNTIIDVKETKESAVKEYVKEQLLPSLELSKETHEIDTFILTQHGGKTKVQLSALEKSLLDPIREAIHSQKVTIASISPLSWTIKSLISLEPSLSTIQIGEMLYLALHYIGIDQTISFSISETANIVETVKTLKGAEPNIQTMYLMTNGVVEQQIKDQLSGTLPIQQLTNSSDDTEGIPTFIKQVIQAGARTLDLPELPIPRFSLGKQKTGAKEKVQVEEKEDLKQELASSASTEAVYLNTQDTSELLTESITETILPPPTVPVPLVNLTTSIPELEVSQINPIDENPKLSSENKPVAHILSLDDEVELDAELEPLIELNEQELDLSVVSHTAQAEIVITHQVTEDVLPTVSELKNKVPTAPKTELVPDAPTMLPSTYQSIMIEKTEVEIPSSTPFPPSPRKVIKNNNDAAVLFKIILITLGALVTTVVVGVGVGFSLLKLSEKNESGLNANPVVQTSAAPSIAPAPSPLPSPSPVVVTIDKSKFKVLVVNATTTPGLAGKVKSSLAAAGYKLITTGNAKGTYTTKGNFLLIADTEKGLLSTLTKDSELTLTLGSNKVTEDANGSYSAVIVIAE